MFRRKPKPGMMLVKAEGGGLDVEDVDLEEVAGLCALHVDGTGEGVDEAEVDAGEVGVGGAGVNLAVEGVAGGHHDFFAGVGLDDGGRCRGASGCGPWRVLRRNAGRGRPR